MRIFRAYYHIICVFITVLLYFSLLVFNKVDLSKIDFNLFVTIAVAIAGFLFTSLSIILSASDKKFIQYLRENGSMQQVEALITIGMTSSSASIILYLCYECLTCKFEFFKHMIVLGVIIGVVCFVISSFNLFKLLKMAAKFDNGDYLIRK